MLKLIPQTTNELTAMTRNIPTSIFSQNLENELIRSKTLSVFM